MIFLLNPETKYTDIGVCLGVFQILQMNNDHVWKTNIQTNGPLTFIENIKLGVIFDISPSENWELILLINAE